MKKVVLFTTGGSIGTKKTADSLGLDQDTTKMYEEEIYTYLPELKELVDVHVHKFLIKSSPEITYEDYINLRNLINSYEEKGFDGAVISHGTDSMEQSAYLLDLITNVKMGVAITGAQKIGTEPVYDGFQNIIDAIFAASDDDAHKQGVLIVFNGNIFFAREATKTHTTSLDTFQAPIYGVAGIVGDDHKTYWHKYNIFREFYPVEEIKCRVEIVLQYPHGDDFLLKYLRQAKVDGIVIEGFGAGNIREVSLEAACNCINDGIPIVLTSMCAGRFLGNTYGHDFCSHGLCKRGMIMGDNLSAIKARIKLAVLLSTTDKTVDIKKEFHKHFYQHMPV